MTTVTTARDGHVALVELRPPAAQHDRAFAEQLQAAAEVLASDAEVRVIVLHGEFGSGWAAEVLEEPPALAGLPSPGGGIEAVAALPQPVIAAIEGDARSAGLELALACDIRLAASGARFAVPETQAGLLPLAGGTQRLPRAVGRAAALRLLLLGETIDAQEARRIGLLSRVVDPGAALTEARVLAEEIAARGPIATRLAKEAVHRGAEMTLEHALRYELDLTVLLQSTEDRAEGVQAFIERRKPGFTGR